VVVKAAAFAFRWVPGLGPLLEGAVHNVESFRDSTNRALDGVKNKIDIYTNTQPAVIGLQNLLGSIPKSMTIPVYVQQMASSTPTAPSANSLIGLLAGSNHRASGGPIDAGTPYLVGEKGPELIIPRQSGHVIDAASTQAMSKKGNGAALYVENYYEAKTPVGQVASDLMFKLAHA
jgi:hypothetical protein